MKPHCLEVRGEFACFTRPEMKVERVSCDLITPSAARAVFEAILWKPAIRWRVRRIEVLAPPAPQRGGKRGLDAQRRQRHARRQRRSRAVHRGRAPAARRAFLRVAYRLHAELTIWRCSGRRFA
jgi:CRISPR-associated protein Cas5d